MPAPPATRAGGSVSPARACALRVIRRVFEQGAYADRALASEAAGLEPRDRALAMALSFGTVQRRATLDHVAAQLVKRPLARLDVPVLAILRLGLFELLYPRERRRVRRRERDGRAGQAAVSATAPGWSTRYCGGARGDGRGMLEGLDDDTAQSAALLHSVPGWLASKWWEELGAEQARALLRVVNAPAESALRVNRLVATVEEVQEALPVPSRRARVGGHQIPEGLVLDGPFDVQGSELWRSGAVQPQSRASMLVSGMLALEPGQRVLDLCAAPGGKTTHLAALMGDRGEIVAVERHPGRAAALERTAGRLGASSVRVEVGDAAVVRGDGPFDRVLVDPPCSGLGTLQSRPDLRWRARSEAIEELAGVQLGILSAGARVVAPGGILVYSVCTISREEGEGVVERFLAEHADFTTDEVLQLLPHRDRTDGFFIARLLRR